MSGSTVAGLIGLAIIGAFFTFYEIRKGIEGQRAVIGNLLTTGAAATIYLLIVWGLKAL